MHQIVGERVAQAWQVRRAREAEEDRVARVRVSPGVATWLGFGFGFGLGLGLGLGLG